MMTSILNKQLAYTVLNPGARVPIKIFANGVPIDEKAKQQLLAVAELPIIHNHIAVMPDAHWGIGATVGSVIPCKGAVIPSAVGVDIGCGMCAVRTSLKATDLPDSLKRIRSSVESRVPVGTNEHDDPLLLAIEQWKNLNERWKAIKLKYPNMDKGNEVHQLGTLGGGNHFIEMCLDESDQVWLMLHSGSRNVGNRIGNFFIGLARKDMEKHIKNLPDKDLAYFSEGTAHFDDYIEAVSWAQDYARMNRDSILHTFIKVLRDPSTGLPPFELTKEVVNCHHNYVGHEVHFGEEVYVTRKGAVSAKKGELGIIPGSMGAKSFIVEGLGDNDSYHSCSHGAGRLLSRGEAKKRYTVEDHQKATEGIECRKDKNVIDETPMAYKDIDAVMDAQKSLVKIIHTLRQVMCIKG